MAARKRRGKPEDFLTPYLGPIFSQMRKGRMTQEELAQKVGIHSTTLGKIESGIGRVRPDLAAAICMALGENPDEIIGAAIENLKNDYKRKSAREREHARNQEAEPLRILEDKVREKHDERIRVDRELRESIFAWLREAMAVTKTRGMSRHLTTLLKRQPGSPNCRSANMPRPRRPA
jgi:transcriptional regulator with XRE-family HTH domain